jgi:hypothetical protein
MGKVLRTLGHLCGVSGAVVGVGAVARLAPLSFLRILPAASLFSHGRVAGSLSLWLIGLGLLLVRFGDGN